jgi:hypothetical protein
MKRREFLTYAGMACLLGMQIGTSGCIGTGAITSNSENQATVDTKNTSVESPTATATNSNSLAGTCPKGRSCTSPQCQLWSDLNGNGRCDRGVQG